MRKIIIVGGSLAMLALTGCAGGINDAPHQQHFVSGLVTDVTSEYTPSGYKTGAAVGAGAGLITGRGHGTESKVIRSAGGALIGAALQKGLTGGTTTYKVQVLTSRGDVFSFKHRDEHIKVGDCVKYDMNNPRAKLFHTSMSDCNFPQRLR